MSKTKKLTPAQQIAWDSIQAARISSPSEALHAETYRMGAEDYTAHGRTWKAGLIYGVFNTSTLRALERAKLIKIHSVGGTWQSDGIELLESDQTAVSYSEGIISRSRNAELVAEAQADIDSERAARRLPQTIEAAKKQRAAIVHRADELLDMLRALESFELELCAGWDETRELVDTRCAIDRVIDAKDALLNHASA